MSQKRIADAYPLSPMQEGMLYNELYAPGSYSYLFQLECALDGPLDADAFERAWQGVVDRHPVLRTAFVWRRSPRMMQVVGKNARLPYRFEDLSDLAADPRAERLEAERAADRARGFELDRAPLLRVTLLRTGRDRHRLLVSFHHLVIDGFSFPLLFREALELYAGEIDGRAADLPARRPFKDYIAWLEAQDPGPAEAYWRRQLDGFVRPTRIGAERRDGAAVEYAEESLALDAALTGAIDELARGSRLTLNSVMEGLWALLLSAYSGDRRVLFGTVTAGRSIDLPGIESMIGMFINTLPMTAEVDPGARLLDWLQQLQVDRLAARELEHSPLVEIRKWSAIPADEPLFDTVVSTQNLRRAQLVEEWSGPPRLSQISTWEKTDFPLSLVVVPGERLLLRLLYEVGRFDAPGVARMARFLESALRRLTAEPETRLADLALLGEAERRQVVVEWNATERPFPERATVDSLVRERAAASPDAPAVVWPGGAWSYRELLGRSRELALTLAGSGVGPETVVGLFAERSPELIQGILAILEAGGTYLPLDPADPPSRLARVIEDARAVAVVAGPGLEERAAALGRPVLPAAGNGDRPAGRPPSGRGLADAAAYAIYTSGSTGRPKGVAISHRSLVNYCLEMARRLAIGPGDSVLQFAPLSFDVLVEEVLPALVVSASVALPGAEDPLAPADLERAVADLRVTGLELPAAYWREWVREMEEERGRPPESLRFLLVGCERPDRGSLATWLGWGVPLYVVFGLTETTITNTLQPVEEVPDDEGPPIGRPIANTRVYVLDPWGRPLPPGVSGELFVGGAGVGRGYLSRPAATAERFVPDPFAGEPGGRLYRTGDGARFRDGGEVDFLGRLDRQVKVRGFRVELGEVEAALEAADEVGEAIVERVDGPAGGRLAAFLVPSVEIDSSATGFGATTAVEVWPAQGDYLIYDEVLYYAMTSDEVRNAAYRAAMRRLVPGRLVVDVGTGADAILSRMCAEAGARKVYAIELDPEAGREARRSVRDAGFEDRIEVVVGDIRSVELPERVDVCVSEQIGTVGSSEGAPVLLNAARRLLTDDGVMIPLRCATPMAAVELPPDVWRDPAMSPVSAHYTEQVFARRGAPFDLRLCLRNFPKSGLLTGEDLFEDLDFSAPVPTRFTRSCHLTVERQGRLDGLLLWVRLYTLADEVIDVLDYQGCWSPVFFPAFYPGVPVEPGDRIEAEASAELAADGLHPDYRLRGILRRAGGEAIEFDYGAPHGEAGFRRSPFYERLFPGGNGVVHVRGRLSEPQLAARLRDRLRESLPEHMVPSAFAVLDELPRTPAGKVDRARLLEMDLAPSEERPVTAPGNRTEALLAEVFAEVLGLDRVGVDENFFALGGDSILSIQVGSRMRQRGIAVSPRQLFEKPTVAGLARLVGEAPAVGAEQGPVVGEAPLTPALAAFLDGRTGPLPRFNLPLLLDLDREIPPRAIERALAALARHHDALRLRFERREDGWSARLAPPGEPPPLAVVDLRDHPAEERRAALEAEGDRVQGLVDAEAGPLLAAAYFLLGDGRVPRLLLAASHLAVDAVSWRILVEDLAAACERLEQGKTVRLPDKTTSWRAWSGRLVERARSDELAGEVGYWLGQGAIEVAPLPRDRRGEGTEASTRVVRLDLDRATTRDLAEAPLAAYGARVEEVLLAALAETVTGWSGGRRLRVDLEGHGRNEAVGEVDLSRTVGWFTAIFPLVIDLEGLEGVSGPGEVLKAVKEQRRSVPGDGLGWGLLRHLDPRRPLRELEESRSEVLFNYLGRLDRGTGASLPFTLRPEPCGRAVADELEREHALVVNANVHDGRLSVEWGFSREVHDRATVENLAREFLAALQRLVAHCLEPGAGGRTPSDFALVDLTQAQVDRLDRRGAIEDLYPLAPLQEGILFEVISAGAGGLYEAQTRLELTGPLDPAALAEAWELTVERHPALRTTFHWTDLDAPVQKVHRRIEAPLVVEDWRDRGPTARRRALEAFLEADRSRGFDLEHPPLLRLFLVRLEEESSLLVFTFHQLLLDGWSLPILFRDLFEAYRALRAGEAVERTRAPAFRELVRWIARQDREEAEAYWSRRLAGWRRPTPPPVDRSAAAGPAERGVERRVLSASASAMLENYARRQRVTLGTLVQGAWALLLGRWADVDEVLFGVTVSGRPAELAGIEEAVGVFINTLPARVRVDEARPVGAWLAALQAGEAEARQHGYASLADIKRWSDLPAHQELFETYLVFQNYPVDPNLRRVGELSIARSESEERDSFPLVLLVTEGESLALELQFDAGRVEERTAARILDRLEALLTALRSDPDRPVREVPLLDAALERRIGPLWRGGSRPEEGEATLDRLIWERASSRPEAPAVLGPGVRWSYRQLTDRAAALAGRLRRAGVTAESVVGLLSERSPEMLVGILAVLRAGGSYLPLDPAYPEERLAFMTADAAASHVLAPRALARRAARLARAVVDLDAPTDGEAAASPVVPEHLTLPRSAAYTVYTSGSTGRPKGVQISHGSLAAYGVEMGRKLGLEPDDRVLQLAALSFDVLAEEVFPAWLAGAAVVVAGAEPVLSIDQLERAVETYGVTGMELPAAYWEQWVDELEASGRRPPEPLRFLILGCERPSPRRLAAWRRSNVPLHYVFGLTETTITNTIQRVAPGRGETEAPLPIGRPVANTEVYVLDRRLRPLPPEVPGELYIGGLGVARGYLGRPALTAASFLPSPFAGASGGRLYRTGDRASYRPDGSFEFLGRRDRQVKVRGFRVELGEVEARLSELGGIGEVAVERVEGPGGGRLVAFVTPEGGPAAGDEADWLARLEAVLPAHMVPSRIVSLDRLPRTPSGKPDRRALSALVAEAEPRRGSGAAPRTGREELLAGVFAQVLGLDAVGVEEDFFALGGDSILSIQVCSRARRAGLEVTPRQLFETPKVAELAAAARPAGTVRAEQGPVVGEVPLVPIQRWFLESGLESVERTAMVFLLELRRRFEPAPLERALGELVAHHDALRLRFEETPEGWRQRSAPAGSAPRLPSADLSRLAGEGQRAAVRRLAEGLRTSLDLARGPIFAAILIDLGGERGQRLLVAAHHLAVDTVSWQILLEDLVEGYRQAVAGETVELPPKTTSVRQWGRHLEEHLASGGLEEETAFWLDDARRDVPPLPRDFPEGDGTEASSATVAVRLPAGETDALLAEAPAPYRCRVDELLLTALAQVLSGWSGGPVRVDREGHGREEIFDGVDLSRTVGWLATLHPVVLDPGKESGARDAIRAVKERLRAVPNGGLGYGVLARFDSPVRAELAAAPPAEVLFNHMGRVDRALADDLPIAIDREPLGLEVDGSARRTHLLRVETAVDRGRLEVLFSFSRNLHRRETIEALAGRFLEALRELIDHCLSPDAGGLTPSDFPLARLESAQLDEITAEHGSIEDLYPLSPLQEGMLFHTLFEPEGDLYVAQLACELDAEIDRGSFEEAWRRLFRRHPALRTSFRWKGLGAPVQLVHREVVPPLEREDWSALPAAERERRWREAAEADRAWGVDPARAPVMCQRLVRWGEGEHRFLWTFHQMLLDGWSLGVVFAEFAELYRRVLEGEEAELPPAPPYRRYIAWLAGKEWSRAERFWRDTWTGTATPLQADRSRPAEGGDRRQWERTVSLGPRVSAELATAARGRRLTLNTLVQGAWAILLSRWGGGREVVFGSTVSGRPAELPDVESMVGLFINTLPVSADVAPERPVDEALSELQRRQAEMREFQYTPLADVQRWAGVPSGGQLFDSFIVFQNYPVEKAVEEDRGGALGVRSAATVERSNYDLTLVVYPGEEIRFVVDAARARFDRTTVSRLARHLETLLSGIAATAGGRIVDLPMLSASERQQLVRETASPAGGPRPATPTFDRQVEAAVARDGSAPAVSCEGATWSYAELWAAAGDLARRLSALGLEPEARVGVLLERSLHLPAALLASARVGAAYVPLDPTYPEERLRLLAEDAGLSALVTTRELAERSPAAADVPRILVDGAESTDGRDAPPSAARPEGLAYLLYTSGSTGRPKGVAVPHSALSDYLAWCAEAYDEPELAGALVHTSSGFDLTVTGLLFPLTVGKRVELVPEGPGVEELVGALERVEECWLVKLTPLHLELLARRLGPVPAGRAGVLVLGGEALPWGPVEAWRRLAPRSRLFNEYGPTEATVGCSVQEVGRRGEPEGESVEIGTAVRGATLHLLGDGLLPAPSGRPGQIFVGGPGLARGYWRDPRATAAAFLPDPAATEAGGRLYATGDLARRLPTGALEFLGRRDGQLKVRGHRVEPGEIEASLRLDEAVVAAAVVLREDRPGDQQLVAYYVAAGDGAPDPAELRAGLRRRLPPYLVPSRLVEVERLPTTAHGKLDVDALPAPAEERRDLAEYAPPETERQRVLAEIWGAVLDVERVGIDDDFFDLGGDSIQSIRVVSRAGSAGIDLTVRQVFSFPTVRQQARLGAPADEAPGPAVAGPVAPSAEQARWLRRGELRGWGEVRTLRAAAGVERGWHGRAIQHLVEQHDALRLRFDGGAPDGARVLAASAVARSHGWVDLTALAGEDRRRAVEGAVALGQDGFDLAAGPLFRALSFELGGGERWLLLCAHRLVVDRRSWRLLLEDLDWAARQLRRGAEPRQPPVAAAFSRWTELQAARAASPELEDEVEAWVALAPAVEPLTADSGGLLEPGRRSPVAAAVEVQIDPASTPVPGSAEEVLLTALAMALAPWAGGGGLLIEREVSGRGAHGSELDLTRTVGPIRHRHPLFLEPPEADGPEAALRWVRRRLQGVPGDGSGFALLAELAAPPARRRLAELARPEVRFAVEEPSRSGAEDLLFAPVDGEGPAGGEPTGRAPDPGLSLEVRATLGGARPRVSFLFDGSRLRRSAVEDLAGAFERALGDLAAHAASEEDRDPRAEDFPLAGLDEEGLRRVAGLFGDLEEQDL